MQKISFWLQHHTKKIGAGLLIFLVALFLWSTIFTALSVTALKSQDLSRATRAAKLAQPGATTFSYLTLNLIPDLRVWRDGLGLVAQSENLSQQLKQAGSGLVSPAEQAQVAPLTQLSITVTSLSTQLTTLSSDLQQSIILKRLFPSELLERTKSITQIFQHAVPILSDLSQGSHTWLILLQNPQELRATGGFLGSYALITMNDGTVQELVIEDVYDTDGQFQGYISAPPGVEEYLSSAQGLRLPNANWSPDFSQSAQTILQFFALGDKQSIEGVIGVNLSVIEEIIEITGQLILLDYDTVVTKETLGDVVRSERSEFFAGSIEKKQILSHIWNQLKFKLSTLETHQYQSLARMLMDQTKQKEIQFYSTNPDIQEAFIKTNSAGLVTQNTAGLDQTCIADYLYLVESNVGINKANDQIDRSVTYQLSDQKSSVSIAFTNNNQPPTSEQLATLSQQHTISVAPHLAYVNYQRLLVPATHQVKSISIDGQPVENWHEQNIEFNDQSFKQIGYLVTVHEQQTSTTNIELITPYTFTTESDYTPCQIVIQKQSGIPKTQYRLTTDKTDLTFSLTSDTVVPL